jgi:branched-chain amino acid transport system permease protein
MKPRGSGEGRDGERRAGISASQVEWQVASAAAALRPRPRETFVRNAAVLGAGVLTAVLMHQLGSRVLGDYAARILLDTGIAIILAVSLYIVNGMAGQFSLGHAGFFALGGYTAASITYYGSLLVWGDALRHGGGFGGGEWLFVAACLSGGLVGAVAGFAMGLPILRLRGDYLAIVTLGFGEIIRVVLQQTNPVLYSAEELLSAKAEQLFPPPLGGALGFSGVPKYTSLFWVYAFVALTLIVAYRLKFSSIGRGMISIREDEIAAQAMGVNVTRWKVRAFVIAAFFAGIAGSLFAHESGIIISPKDAGFQRSIEAVIMVVLGGNGSISGVVLAAVFLTIVPELLRNFAEYRMIVYAILLIGTMLLRPQGLFGRREIWEFFWRPSAARKELSAP